MQDEIGRLATHQVILKVAPLLVERYAHLLGAHGIDAVV
jgi:hypothetical protein